jgi:hypothetical protein
MSKNEGSVAVGDTVPATTIRFEATDVTGTHSAVANVQRSLPTAAVVDSLVKQMTMPENVPYGLRDDTTGKFLNDDAPIGEQLTPQSRTTLTPKTHLG